MYKHVEINVLLDLDDCWKYLALLNWYNISDWIFSYFPQRNNHVSRIFV